MSDLICQRSVSASSGKEKELEVGAGRRGEVRWSRGADLEEITIGMQWRHRVEGGPKWYVAEVQSGRS